MRADDVVDCHVLVIGSGGAGVRAAIEAAGTVRPCSSQKPSREREDAPYGRRRVKRGPAPGGLLRNPLRGYTSRGRISSTSPDLVKILVKESPQRMDDLIRWGAVFDFYR